MSAAIAHMRRTVEAALSKLEAEFVPAMKLTFIARLPGNDNADVLITSDSVSEVLRLVERRLSDEERAARGPQETP